MYVLLDEWFFKILKHYIIYQMKIIRKSPMNAEKGTGRLSLFNLIEDVENAKDQLR